MHYTKDNNNLSALDVSWEDYPPPFFFYIHGTPVHMSDFLLRLFLADETFLD